MGLDTSHDCWHGPYSAFNRWRNAVAKAAGWSLTQHDVGGDVNVLDYSIYIPKNYQGDWDVDPADPLTVFFVHSDCDGVIPHRFCLPLALRLAGLQVGDGYDSFWPTNRFIGGLIRAHVAGEDVDFH